MQEEKKIQGLCEETKDSIWVKTQDNKIIALPANIGALSSVITSSLVEISQEDPFPLPATSDVVERFITIASLLVAAEQAAPEVQEKLKNDVLRSLLDETSEYPTMQDLSKLYYLADFLNISLVTDFITQHLPALCIKDKNCFKVLAESMHDRFCKVNEKHFNEKLAMHYPLVFLKRLEFVKPTAETLNTQEQTAVQQISGPLRVTNSTNSVTIEVGNNELILMHNNQRKTYPFPSLHDAHGAAPTKEITALALGTDNTLAVASDTGLNNFNFVSFWWLSPRNTLIGGSDGEFYTANKNRDHIRIDSLSLTWGPANLIFIGTKMGTVSAKQKTATGEWQAFNTMTIDSKHPLITHLTFDASHSLLTLIGWEGQHTPHGAQRAVLTGGVRYRFSAIQGLTMNQALFLTILDQLQQTEEGKKVIRANMAHIKQAVASYTPQEQALIIRNGNLSLEIQAQTEHKQREFELKRNVAAAQELAQLHDALHALSTTI